MKKYNFLFLLLLIPILLGLSYFRNVKNPAVLSVYDDSTSIFAKFIPQFPREIKRNKFNEIVHRTREKKGTYGIYIKEIGGSEEHSYNKNELFYGASLYKVPIAAATQKEIELGNVKLEQETTILGAEFADGTGSLNQLYPGANVTIREVLDKLLKESDNTAQNILLRVIPKEQVLNAFNLVSIKNYFYVNNTVTPRQVGSFFENLILEQYLDETNKEILLNKMSTTLFDDRIHQGLTTDIKFSHKIGNWPETSSWHDCGIVQKNNKQYVACVMSRNTTFKDFLSVTKDVGEFLIILF